MRVRSIAAIAKCPIVRIEAHQQIQGALEKLGSSSTPSQYAFLLKECANAKALVEGKLVHAHIVKNGYDHEIYLNNLLLMMYRRCGCLEDAQKVFREMLRRDVVSWNSMMTAYAENGHLKEALAVYNAMVDDSIQPDNITYTVALSLCSRLDDLAVGKAIHTRIIVCKVETNVTVDTALVNMYGKCGNLEDAENVFVRMRERNVISWTAMLTAYTNHGHSRQALHLLHVMDFEGVHPNDFTLVVALSACSNSGALSQGKLLHARISQSSSSSNSIVENALITMYSKFGCLEDARRIFDSMKRRDVVSWTVMITAYQQHGDSAIAMEMYREMDIIPSSVTFINVLRACANLQDGRAIHQRIVTSQLHLDLHLQTALVNMYAKCDSLSEARSLFDSMKMKDVVATNTMIVAYVLHGNTKEALHVYEHMEELPNAATFTIILGVCSSWGNLEYGRKVHSRIVTSGLQDPMLENTLINMYAKSGGLPHAEKVFEQMIQRTTVSWNAMIGAYTQYGLWNEAIQTYRRMNLEGGVADSITFIEAIVACSTLDSLEEGKAIHSRAIGTGYGSVTNLNNALITMYAKCGDLETAESVFSEMKLRDIVSWNAMIAAYCQHCRDRKAMELYHEMVSSVEPDSVTFISVLVACSNIGSLTEGKAIHAKIISKGLIHSSLILDNALLNMYAKCGTIEDASAVFDAMKEKDSVTWTSIIAAYAQHGHGDEAIELYEQMALEGIQTDKVTFISILISCSQSGLLQEGCKYFSSMVADHSITPTIDHYVCMIDLLGRLGRLDDAEDLINSMPVSPDSVTWMTLLSACRVHADVLRGTRIADYVVQLNPGNTGSHIILSNIYAASGEHRESNRLWNLSIE